MTIDTGQRSRALGAIRRRLEAAENAGDTDFISGLFAEDAVVIVPDPGALQSGQVGKAAGARRGSGSKGRTGNARPLLSCASGRRGA